MSFVLVLLACVVVFAVTLASAVGVLMKVRPTLVAVVGVANSAIASPP